MSDRVALRKQLNCKSFKWYTENIYPEMDFPLDSTYVGRVSKTKKYHLKNHHMTQSLFKQIQNVDAQGCLVSYLDGSEAVLHVCHETIDNQVFVLTDLGELRNHDLCMDADSYYGKVKTLKCHKNGGNQKWEYNVDVSVIGISFSIFKKNYFLLIF